MRASTAITVVCSCLIVSGCNDRSTPPIDNRADVGPVTPDGGTAPPPDTGGGGDARVPDAGPPDSAMPTSWTVSLSADAPEAVRWTAGDVQYYLEKMGLETEVVETNEEPGCETGHGHVVFFGDGLGAADSSLEMDQSYAIRESRCEEGTVVELSGGGLLGRQYAGYQWVRMLGVRYFHPEQEFVPPSADWPEEAVDVVNTPDFQWRSVSLHLTHPLELGDPIRLGVETYYAEVQRYIDWNIKNLASFGIAGVGNEALAEYGTRRGFPRSTGFSLYNLQQGGGGVIDPDDPRTPEEQIAEAIDSRMAGPPHPEFFSFTFNPSEFTEIDDVTIVDQLTFIANYFEENYPDTILLTTNHGTPGEPTDTYGVRYFNLPKFAPANLGVKVHTLMFYDLFRPAPVYGNQNFNYLYEFMVEEHRERRLWHFPEAAWWLTFDIAVPLYLPVTLQARDMDIQNLAFMLDGKLDGHRTFGSGHEWGYWQNEYCSLRMPENLEYRYEDCIDDITHPLGAAADEVKSVLLEAIRMQERDFIYDEEALRYMVGTDPETELAAQVGIVFHPLPPKPDDVMRWTLDETQQWLDGVEPRITRMDREYHALLDRLENVSAMVPDTPDDQENDRSGFRELPDVAGARTWFREIRDGIAANALRARHAHQVYGAVVRLRQARLTGDETLEQEAMTQLEAAEATTGEVKSLVDRREDDYRYRNAVSRAYGEGENWTVYDYRYLHRTHEVYFYSRIDDLVRAAFEGSGDPFSVNGVMPGPSDSVDVELLAEDISDVSVDFGDGSMPSIGTSHSHTYAQPGIYTVGITAMQAGSPVDFMFDVAALQQRFFTGKTGVLIEPETDLAGVIEGVLPALVFGPIDAATLPLGTAGDDGRVAPGDWNALDIDSQSQAVYETLPANISIPLAIGDAEASLTLQDARVLLQNMPGPVRLEGNLETQGVIDAVVTLSGAFTEEDARATVADALGYTASTLPEVVSFIAEYQL